MPEVDTTTPANTPTPIGLYNHVEHRPARTVIGVRELPKPGVLLTMNVTAVTAD
jgi:enamine deaminase RidA (YjgF/YER057c/UK114 family)